MALSLFDHADPDARYREQPPLFERQGDVIPRLVTGSYALWWEPRMGKTRPVYESLRLLFSQDQIDAYLVLCPVQAKEVHRRYCEIFLGYLQPFMAEGLTPTAIPRECAGVVINPDLLAFQERAGARFQGWSSALLDWMRGKRVVLIQDESHLFCLRPSADRYKEAMNLSKCANRVWQLTGTPYESSALDAHYQLRHLGSTYPHYWTKTDDFGKRFTQAKRNVYKGQVLKNADGTVRTYKSGLPIRVGGFDFKGVENEGQLLAELAAVVDRRVKGIEEMPRRFDQWVDHYDQDLRELSSGELERLRSELAPLKAQRTIEYLEAIDVAPVIVFGWTRDFTIRVANHFRAPLIIGGMENRTRVRYQDEFQAGKHRILVANIKAGGTSVELSAAAHAIFGEIHWSAAALKQAEQRMAGPNQQSDMLAHYLLVSGSVDEKVWDTVLDKGAAMDRLDVAAVRLRELRLDLAELE